MNAFYTFNGKKLSLTNADEFQSYWEAGHEDIFCLETENDVFYVKKRGDYNRMTVFTSLADLADKIKKAVPSLNDAAAKRLSTELRKNVTMIDLVVA